MTAEQQLEKQQAREEEMVRDYVAQLEALDAERFQAQTELYDARCLLLDVEGSLLAYWTDLPEAECERLRVAIRNELGDFERGVQA